MATQVPQPQDDNRIQFARRLFSHFSLNNSLSCVPIDETERQRFDDLLRITRDLFGDRSVLPPFAPSGRTPSVLDCGYGEGAWIEHFLEEHAVVDEFDVTGIDIYTGRWGDDQEEPEEDEDDADAVQEFHKVRWNLNARLNDAHRQVDAPQLKPETFVLINSRFLADGINSARWPQYVHELRMMLEEGGWLQMVELQLHVQSSSGQLADNSCLTRWWKVYVDAMQDMGKNPRIGRDLGGTLSREGFVDVSEGIHNIPIGDWYRGRESLGNDFLSVIDRMLLSLSLWPFLRIRSVQENQYRSLIRGARQELRQDGLRLYMNLHYAYGRRPRVERRGEGRSSR